jgi:hypothetical protein
MRMWASAAAVMPLLWAAAAQAQAMKGLLATDVVAYQRIVDLRLYPQQGHDNPSSFIRGMLVQQGILQNAFVGVGIAEMYGRKKRGARLGDAPIASRKPAVSFVVKF